MSRFQLSRRLTTAALASFMAFSSFAQLSGAGSTLSRDLMSRWSQAYGPKAGGVTYEAVGSTRGLEHARRGEVDFAVSDLPLTAVALQQSSLRQLPLAATAVTVIVNLPGLENQTLRLSGDVLASIFSGKVTNWDHSTIRGINPNVKLPNLAITPVWRADGSGQSYVLSSFLTRRNGTWARSVGITQQFSSLPGRGVVGGAALVAAVRSTPGAIGYEGLGAARAANLQMVALRNAADQFVAPNETSVTEALSKARWSFDNNENAADLDASPGAGTYPMTTVIYALIPASSANAKKSSGYLVDAVQRGDASVTAAGFVPLPGNIKTALAAK